MTEGGPGRSSNFTLPKNMRVFERGWLSSNCILFMDDQHSVLVDSGYSSHADQTVRLVQHALAGRPLAKLINTHIHSDHAGGNAAIQRAFGCQTIVPVGSAPAVSTWDEARLSYRATGQRCERFTIDGTVTDGDELEFGDMVWTALAAPGHDPESMIFFNEENGILISADALWEDGFGVVFPELGG